VAKELGVSTVPDIAEISRTESAEETVAPYATRDPLSKVQAKEAQQLML
jgi:hypothetical protein